MRGHWAIGALVATAACRPGCEAEVVGAADEGAEASVWATMEGLREALDPALHLCVASIRLDRADGLRRSGSTSQYRGRTRSVHVASPAPQRVREGLCRAVAAQNGLSLEGPPWGAPGLGEDTFARACAVGSTWGALVRDACPHDPPGALALAEASRHFTVDAAIDLRPGLVADAIETQQWLWGDDMVVAVWDEVFVPWSKPNDVPPSITYPAVDEETGELRSVESGPLRSVSGEVAVADDGVALRLLAIDAPDGDAVWRRVLDADGALRAAGCPAPGEQVFFAEGAFWSVWPEGGYLVFTRWARQG